MSYVTRMVFHAGSHASLWHTHINSNVATEFSDIDSLEMPLMLSGKVEKGPVVMRSDDGIFHVRQQSVHDFHAAQWNRNSSRLNAVTVNAVQDMSRYCSF